MVTFLITSILFLGLFAIAIYFWQKPRNSNEAMPLPPSIPLRALFSNIEETELFETVESNGHQELLDRASGGDLDAVLEARDLDVYSQVLTAAVSRATSEGKLTKLASHVAQNNLPVNSSLAEAIVSSWNESPNRHTTAKALHFAALSDNAELFSNVLEMALNMWRAGRLNDMSGMELQALLNGEYWLLSSSVRNSGTGFVLKRTLSSARRELEGTTNN